MWRQLLFVLPLTLTTAIKVPVDNTEDSSTTALPVTASDPPATEPEYYTSENGGVDSYLIPPDPHKPEETLPDDIVTPATFLIPPAPDKQNDYYTPSSAEQSDWYPIAQQLNRVVKSQRPPLGAIPIFLANENEPQLYGSAESPRGKPNNDQFLVPIPSVNLEPPKEDAPNDYIVPPPSEELELPAEVINQQFSLQPVKQQLQFNPVLTNKVPVNFRFKPEPLALHLLPPKPEISKYKSPTKLYPKKFAGGFKPVPIPIGQFAEDSSLEVPQAKPLKYFKPIAGIESELISPDDKKVYLYEQAELKRKLKGEEAGKESLSGSEETYAAASPSEQEASESNFRYPGRNVYAAPIRQAPPAPPAPPQQESYPAPPPGERTEFRMHGMKGPHSYQFGYDTGKGKNRQFRYEERDNDGVVRGHYGYMDKHGKLRVVNYKAHPELGFQADAPVEKE